ncbi:hypothetical protein Tco_0298508 [Tanacetum coccineum]
MIGFSKNSRTSRNPEKVNNKRRSQIPSTKDVNSSHCEKEENRGVYKRRHHNSKIRLHQEKEVEFNQWRSKNFKDEHPALTEEEEGVEDEGEFTLYLMRRSLEVLRKLHYDDSLDAI